jgi:hypothetical protein
MKFTAALARRTVTTWANDRSVHVLLDGTVIRTRPSQLSEHDRRELVRRGARLAGTEPARSAVTVGMLTTSPAIEVHRTVDRDGYVGPGGTQVLLDPPLEGQRVTLRFEGALLHVLSAVAWSKPCQHHWSHSNVPPFVRPDRQPSRRHPQRHRSAQCVASTRTAASWSPDSLYASDAPTPARQSSSPSRTLSCEYCSTTSN